MFSLQSRQVFDVLQLTPPPALSASSLPPQTGVFQERPYPDSCACAQKISIVECTAPRNRHRPAWRLRRISELLLRFMGRGEVLRTPLGAKQLADQQQLASHSARSGNCELAAVNGAPCGYGWGADSRGYRPRRQDSERGMHDCKERAPTHWFVRMSSVVKFDDSSSSRVSSITH